MVLYAGSQQPTLTIGASRGWTSPATTADVMPPSSLLPITIGAGCWVLMFNVCSIPLLNEYQSTFHAVVGTRASQDVGRLGAVPRPTRLFAS
jgi:hypothetical protein